MLNDEQVDMTGDALSALAREVAKLNLGNAYTRLTAKGLGFPDAQTKLQNAKPEAMVTGKVANVDDANGLLSGLWLWHDWLDESHKISQSIETPTGSFWHAIMHRREGDFSNSKYWYAKVGKHIILQALAPRASLLIHPMPADKSLLRLIRDGWDPNAFVDFCEQLDRTPEDPRYAVAVRLQQMEWRMLFEHCARSAVGR